MLEVISFSSILGSNPIPKMMKILGLFLGLIYISLTPLSAGTSDLHTAAKKGDIATITSLLDKGADIEARTKEGETPLHSAAYKGNLDIILALLDRGADIEARDENGDTPLHIAVQRRQSEAILSLLDRGADAHAKNNKGKRAIDIANDRQIEKDKAYQQLQAASK